MKSFVLVLKNQQHHTLFSVGCVAQCCEDSVFLVFTVEGLLELGQGVYIVYSQYVVFPQLMQDKDPLLP